jgi:5-oxoprolinase (ATP-hydrolysing)
MMLIFCFPVNLVLQAVKFQIRHLGDNWHDGDVLVSNHPQAGGSHLPDITVITPVFADVDVESNADSSPSSSSRQRRPVFFVASRGHHADIGGIFPGSMPPWSKHLYQEGAAILSHKLVSAGVFDEAGVTELLQAPGKIVVPDGEPACSGTRNLSDNLSDLRAQVAANQKGIQLMGELIAQYGLPVVQAYMHHIQKNGTGICVNLT